MAENDTDASAEAGALIKDAVVAVGFQGLPRVLITLDPESPDNPAFKYGTFGKLAAPGGFECYVLQRPPTGDHPSIGKWSGKVHAFVHPEHGLCYELQNVVMADGTARTAILVHSANWFQQLLGCLALGRSIDVVVDQTGKWLGKPGAKQLGVTSSKDAVGAFWSHMGGKDFLLTIA